MDKLRELLNKNQVTEQLSSPLIQWGGLLCIVILFCFMIIEPYMQWRESEWVALQQKSIRLKKLTQLSDNSKLIRKVAQEISTQFQTAQNSLLDSKTHSRAIGQQVDFFEDLYRPHNLKFVGRRFGEPAKEPWLGERIDSQWRLSGSSEDILLFLYGMASAPHLMEVVRMEIKPGQRSRGKIETGYEIALKLRSYRKLPLRDLRVRSGNQ